MRNLDPMWMVLVFVAGLAVGSKMVGGGWVCL